MGDAQITEGAKRVQISLESINNDFYGFHFKKHITIFLYCILWFYVYGITQKRKEKTEMRKDKMKFRRNVLFWSILHLTTFLQEAEVIKTT